MTRKPPSNTREIIDMLIRRKMWIIACLIIVPPLVFVAGRYWPKKYRSETLILVDPQRVPEEYVKATVTGDITDRLQTISDEVMSRTRLLMIANKDNLYQKVRRKHGDDGVIYAIRKDITVDIIQGTAEHSIDGFKIAYIASTPALAQEVTRQIADLFIQENIKERDQDAESTAQFIQNQLITTRASLALQDQKIRDFKAAHLGELPEQESANLSMISEYQSLAQQNSEAIDRANQQEVYLQSMLGTSQGQKQLAAPPTPLQLQLQAARNQLADDRQKYTEAYPDVVRLRDEVATLEAAVKHQPQSARHATTASEPSVQQQLESQLLATKQEVRARTERQQQLERQVGEVQSKVQSLPAVQQEYESLSRDYNEMQKNYESLLEKEQASGMAEQLELHNESERFRVLDPANLPTVPYSPSPQKVDLGGVLGALLLGLGLAYLAEMRDPSIHTADEAEMYLSVPLIIALPSLNLNKALAAGANKKMAPAEGT
jgi:polysaccharide chain length determinant protein (PEP-CTERM system associated)